MGSAYPVYASFSLLESGLGAKEKEQEATQWLTYWAIYGIISAAEQLVESRPPLYYHIKLAFLLWLQSSRYQVELPGSSERSYCRSLFSKIYIFPFTSLFKWHAAYVSGQC